jgi:hypothetical protein
VTSRVAGAAQPHVGDEGQPSRTSGAPGAPDRRNARHGLVVGALVAALVGAFAVVVVGGSPTALLVVAVASTTLALRTWLRTTLALAAVLSGAFALLAVGMRLWPVLGAPLTALLAVPAVVAAVSLVVLWRRRTTALAMSRGQLALGAGLAMVSVLQVVTVPLSRWLSDSPKLAWMMRNDNTWNLVSSRFIVEDGGLDPASHRNPAPLANEVVALFAAPGRSAVARGDLLAHDLYRASEALLLMVGATSLLAGLLVASAFPAARVWSRAVLGLLAAVIPWTWSLAGLVFVYGFWNSLPSAILVLAAWAAWTSSERRPVVSSGVLALVGTGLLAAWAPLVLLPACLGVAVVVWRRRAHLDLRGLALVAWLMPLVVLLAYLALVTRGDITAASDALAAEGLFPAYGENLPPVFWLVPLGLLLVLSVWTSVRLDLVGTAVVGLAGAIGIFYLMHQRAGSEGGPWGYYPQKFAWTLSFLAPMVLLMSARGAFAVGLRRAQRASLVAGTAMLAGVLLWQIPPADPRPVSSIDYPVAHRTPDYRLSSVLPAVSIALPDRSSALDPAVADLLRLEDPARKVVVSRWFEDPGDNAFVNFWLLQLPVDKDDELPRPYAYGLDSFDPVGLCDLVRDWGGGVEIYTHSDTLERELKAQCPRLEFAVRLR